MGDNEEYPSLLIVKLKGHEPPCTRCGRVGSHCCDSKVRVACSAAVLHAYATGRYREDQWAQDQDAVTEHVATCARCGAWARLLGG